MRREPATRAEASRLVLAFAALTLVAVVTTASAAGAVRDRTVATVVVRLQAERQVMQGFGMTDRVWTDPHLSNSPTTVVPPAAQKAILTALYRRLGLTRVRPYHDPGLQPARNATPNFAGKLGELQAAFVKQAKPYGLKTFFPAPVYLEDWVTESDVEGFVDYSMSILRFWRSKGLEPPLYSPLNEPEISKDFSADWMRKVVALLGKRMRAEGFKTKLVVPDDENPVSAYERAAAVLADPEARKYVAAVAYHIYKGDPSDWARIRDLAARYKLPVWMTEFADRNYESWPEALDWAVKMHGLMVGGDVAAIDYLWGFFGDWVGGETLVAIHFQDGVYRGHSPTPAYYLTGQWSRFVRPGYRRVVTNPSQAGDALVSAFKGRGRAVIVAVNSGGAPTSLRFRLLGGRAAGPVTAIRSSPSEQWRAAGRVPVRSNAFTAVLPPQSVTTFVAKLR